MKHPFGVIASMFCTSALLLIGVPACDVEETDEFRYIPVDEASGEEEPPCECVCVDEEPRDPESSDDDPPGNGGKGGNGKGQGQGKPDPQ